MKFAFAESINFETVVREVENIVFFVFVDEQLGQQGVERPGARGVGPHQRKVACETCRHKMVRAAGELAVDCFFDGLSSVGSRAELPR